MTANQKRCRKRDVSTGSTSDITLMPPRFVPLNKEQERQAIEALADILIAAVQMDDQAT